MRRPWEISRRTLLGGAGALVALPLLEAMLPSIRRARAAGAPPPRRMAIFHVPCGVNMQQWRPTGTDGVLTLSPTLAPLEPLKGEINVISGLCSPPGDAGHTTGIAQLLTGTKVPQTLSSTVNGISVDQLAAKHLKQYTRIASLELGTETLVENPNAEPGWSSAYKDSIVWSDMSSPLPKEVNPAAAFDRLFAGIDPTATAADVAKRRQYRQSVLDTVREQASSLSTKLGRSDQRKVDEYLSGVRDLERQLQQTALSCSAGTRPPRVTDLPTRVRQMLDLIVLAFKCDITRVATFQFEHTDIERQYTFAGVNRGYHIGCSHNGGDAEKLTDYAKVNRWLIEQFTYLITQLHGISETDGSVLDTSVVLFTSELGDGDRHEHTNLPVVLAGRGGGAITPGRHLIASTKTAPFSTQEPIANLFISMLATVGVNVPTFGETGTRPLANL